MRSLAFLLGVATGVSACSGRDEVPTSTVTTVDSAGISITTSTGTAWSVRETPVVDSVPLISLGADTDGVLFRTISSARRTSDGRIVALDRGPLEILVFDPEGQLLHRLGGKGDGPAEFRQLWQIHLVGDTIVAFDSQASRITTFGLDGSLLATLPIVGEDHPIWRYQLVGRLGADWLLIGHIYLPGACGTSGTCWDTLPSLRISSDGTVEEAGHFEAAGVTAFGNAGYPFAARTWAQPSPAGFVFGDGRDAEVRIYSSAGDLTGIARWPAEPRPASQADVDRYLNATLEQLRERGVPTTEVDRRFDGMDLLDFMPAFDRVLVDAGGRIWLEPYAPWYEPHPTEWTVIAPDGAWLGSVRMPENTDIREIGADYVLGVWRDELDVQHLRLFAMEPA